MNVCNYEYGANSHALPWRDTTEEQSATAHTRLQTIYCAALRRGGCAHHFEKAFVLIFEPRSAPQCGCGVEWESKWHLQCQRRKLLARGDRTVLRIFIFLLATHIPSGTATHELGVQATNKPNACACAVEGSAARNKCNAGTPSQKQIQG